MHERNSTYPLLLPEMAEAQVRYYSLARHALVQAFRLCGITNGSRVLLPAFLCRDVLASVHACGAVAVWYDISSDLTPELSEAHWPEAQAVLAVNYFGFPQNLKPFQDYARRTKARIIEDNAHGYGSCDELGSWLGLRSDIGIFSMRKTMRIPDGAALVVRDQALAQLLLPTLPFNGAGIYRAQLIKHQIRSLPIIGEICYRIILGAYRCWRRWRDGSIVKTDPLAEYNIPTPIEPWSGLQHSLSTYHFPYEAARRRAAYLACMQMAAKYGAEPVFKILPEGCVPYGFAFRACKQSCDMMTRFAKFQGWDCVIWPDLPEAIQPESPDYYRNIHLINFLW